MKVSIVIPTYNERENIEKLLPEIFGIFDRGGIDGSVIVVDDNSPDGTADAVEGLKREFPITLIRRQEKGGIGSAYITGFGKALEQGADVIMEMDADFSHSPEEIPNFVREIESSDVVIGSRYIKDGEIENWNFIRRIISKGGNLVARILLGLDVEDVTTGYRAYRRETLEGIELGSIESNGYAFQAEMLVRARERGFSIKEMPITFRDRVHGKSKLSRMEIIRFIVLCINLRLRGL
ncbi:MAG: polyprenol monophosphomannose synthase [Candidatus Altiarchaeales archaeon]|nr:polyprenol monophosphomannose synthase [Candidatus Altiarchaeota archaeon]MBU4436755.1 polyprenol monophosphomannose synthase [Candidatus Altiarchaeota archaeon]MCG2783313.1 polyprenol monophosphomannose synthase [Candidatus Altiarchaeales archaeon]